MTRAPDDPEDRRARRLASRRTLILDAAAAEFLDAGYEDATLERIGERVGLSKASVYYYFGSKHEILANMLTRVIEDIEARVAKLVGPTAGPEERLRAFVRAHVEVAAETPAGRLLATHLHTVMNDESTATMRRGHEQKLVDIIAEGAAAGAFRDLPPRPVVKLIYGGFNALSLWCDPAGPLSLEQIAEVGLDLVLGGLRETKTLV